jgi:hypothetical protein
VIDNGTDPWAMVADAVHQKSAAPRNAFEVTEADPEDDDRERSETEVQNLLDQINEVMGRGTRRRSSSSDRRSSAMDAHKCTECRLADSGQPGDVRTEIRNAISRLQRKLTEF